MDRSVSVVVIAHNGEAKLAMQVRGLIESLPDIASQFEVLIIDDGSTDDTCDVAQDLSREYPQIHFFRRPMRYGETAAIGWASRHATGEVLVIYDAADAPGHFQTHHLRFLRVRPDLVMETPSHSIKRRRPTDATPGRMRVDRQQVPHPNSSYPRIIQRNALPQSPKSAEQTATLAIEQELRNHFRHDATDAARFGRSNHTE